MVNTFKCVRGCLVGQRVEGARRNGLPRVLAQALVSMPAQCSRLGKRVWTRESAPMPRGLAGGRPGCCRGVPGPRGGRAQVLRPAAGPRGVLRLGAAAAPAGSPVLFQGDHHRGSQASWCLCREKRVQFKPSQIKPPGTANYVDKSRLSFYKKLIP